MLNHHYTPSHRYTDVVAEVFNTGTSILYVLAAATSIRLHPALYAAEPQYFLVQFSILLTGIGSMLFHATLRYDMQLLDELPLFAIALSAAYCFYFREPVQILPVSAASTVAQRPATTGGQSGAWRQGLLTFGCVMWLATTLTLFFTPRESAVHVITRGAMSICFAVMLVYVFSAAAAISKEIQDALAARGPRLAVAKGPTELKAGDVRALFAAAFLFFVGSVVTWIVDNFFCSLLRGLPIYPQLHAFGWHLGSAVATWCLSELGALQLLLGRAVRLDAADSPDVGCRARAIGIGWAAGVVPYVTGALADDIRGIKKAQ